VKKGVFLVATMGLVSGFVILTAGPAAAKCHVVQFSKSDYPVKEGDGKVTVTINRAIFAEGCSGTIDYNTIDGAARAPSDYKATSGKHDFTNPLEPTFSFDVPIEDDNAFEGEEKFSVHFKHTPSGTGSGFGPVEGTATVSIQDNDPSPTPPPPAGTSPKTSPTATATASPTATPTATTTPGSPLPLEEASPEESPTVAVDEKAAEEDGAPTGLIVAAIAFVLAAGAGVGLWFLRRTPAG
jgi:hypothetical protein